MINFINKHPQVLYLLGIGILVPALLINLGLINIFMAVDEPTRALVALEMMIRENLWFSTLQGEPYTLKPPLFPWIIIVFFKVFGIGEWALRLPTVFSFIGFAFTIFLFVRNELGTRLGVLTAFLFVTLGRLLFWETFLGYIDTTFSWVAYTGIMSVYYFDKKKNDLLLFLTSYFFMTIGFFLKGMPAILFQGITLGVFFIVEKKWRRLISLQHLAGILLFAVVLGLYLLKYDQYNDYEKFINSMWSESSGRTITAFGVWESVKQLFIFPVEMVYHYLPWSLLLLYLFRRNFKSTLAKNAFLRFNFLIALINLLPYWASPDVYPKYIMMLVPMFITVSVYFFMEDQAQERVLTRILNVFLLMASLVLSVGYLILHFIPQLKEIDHLFMKVLPLFLISITITFLYWKVPGHRLLLFALLLLVGRMAFATLIWPMRAPDFEQYEQDALEVTKITGNEKIYFYAPVVQYGFNYVLTKETWQIIEKAYSASTPDLFYITDEDGLEKIRADGFSVQIYYTFQGTQHGSRIFYLIKLHG
jgi:4-amino-4-deoxy-L-arabinose transferase-like glycosyltransferase